MIEMWTIKIFEIAFARILALLLECLAFARWGFELVSATTQALNRNCCFTMRADD